MIASQRAAPTPQDSRAVIINGLLSLRMGILEYDGANKANVFDSNGALVHELTLVSDNGNELGGGKPQYREVLAQKLLDQGLIRDESQLKHRYTLSQTPSQAAFRHIRDHVTPTPPSGTDAMRYKDWQLRRRTEHNVLMNAHIYARTSRAKLRYSLP
eukprot:COSAG02_NODE_986_length_15452_cov_17.818602_13_plen_157_part_00